MCGEGLIRSGHVCTSGAVWARVAAQLREASLSVGGRAGVQSTLPPCVYARCAGAVLCTHSARLYELSQISSQVKRAARVRWVCGCSPGLVFKNTVGMPCGCIGPSRYRTGMHTRGRSVSTYSTGMLETLSCDSGSQKVQQNHLIG